MVERRQQAVGDDVLGGGAITNDQVRDGLHVPSVPVEQVGQHLGSPPTKCLDRHPNLRVACWQRSPIDPASQGRYPASPSRVSA